MKKTISILLILALVFSMGSAVFASATGVGLGTVGSADGLGEGPNIPVTVTAEAPSATISVDVTWQSMSFTLTQKWNTTTGKYDFYWASASNKITVKNNSDAAITAAFAFAPTAVGTAFDADLSDNAGFYEAYANGVALTSTMVGQDQITTSLSLNARVGDTIAEDEAYLVLTAPTAGAKKTTPEGAAPVGYITVTIAAA